MGPQNKIYNEIKKILNEEFSNRGNSLGIVLLSILFVSASIFIALTFNKSYLIYYSIFVILFIAFFAFFINRKNKNNQAKAFLKEAFDSMRVNNVKNTMEALIKSYKTVKNSRVLEFIFLYTTQFTPDMNQQAVIVDFEYEELKSRKTADKHLIDILIQFKEAISAIQKHSAIIKKSQDKIEELKNDMEFASDDDILLEFNQLIKRYRKIIDNSENRIKLLDEKIARLAKLKHNFILLKKLNKAREELRNIEESMWSDYFLFGNEDNRENNLSSEESIKKHSKLLDEIEKDQIKDKKEVI